MGGIGLAALNTLFVIYAIGFIAMCAWLVLLYQHVLRKADELQMDAVQKLEARLERNTFILLMLPAFLSLIYLALMPAHLGPYNGFCYGLLSFLMPLHGMWAERQMAKARQAALATPG